MQFILFSRGGEIQRDALAIAPRPRPTATPTRLREWGRWLFPLSTRVFSPGKDLDGAIATAADDPSPVLAPDDAADALAAHGPVAGDFLGAAALLQRPEAQGGVVAGRDEFAPVRGQRERGDC